MTGLHYLTRSPSQNVQVTHDLSPNNARSESSLIINPVDARNMIGSSKRFTNPAAYQFSLAAYASSDGGNNWVEAPLQLPMGADFTSDPAVACDDVGNAYLMGLIWKNGPKPHQIVYLGLAVYSSSDGGTTWSKPDVIYKDPADKQEIAADTNPMSPHHGNVYAAWDGGQGIEFARTQDHGATWIGTKQGGVNQSVGSLIAPKGAIASISIGGDGTVFIFYLASPLGVVGINVVHRRMAAIPLVHLRQQMPWQSPESYLYRTRFPAARSALRRFRRLVPV